MRDAGMAKRRGLVRTARRFEALSKRENSMNTADLLAASKSTVDRLADFPNFLRNHDASVLAEILEEELAKHRAVIANANR